MSENASSQSINQATASFYASNPDFSLLGANLYKNELLDGLNWDGLDRENILEMFRIEQRLMRLCNDESIMRALVAQGLDSAHRIAALTEDAFMSQYAGSLGCTEDTARQIYRNAGDIVAKTMLLWANVKDVVASPHYSTMKVNNVGQNITSFFEELPSYQELFGSLDYYEVDEAKSIFGPAAYLVDLMRIVDEYIEKDSTIPTDHTLDARRPDLRKILLTSENTYKTIPYLQIVNEILVNIAKNYPNPEGTEGMTKEQEEAEVFKSMVTSKYPMNLPFNLPLEQMRLYLGQLKSSLHEIFEAFDMTEGGSVETIREFLGLSREEYDILTTPAADAKALGECYGFADGLLEGADTLEKFLEKTNLDMLDVFMVKTGLPKDAATQLIYQDLSKKEIAETQAITGKFFINNVLGSKGCLSISTSEDAQGEAFEQLLNLDFVKLDRMNRFIRLAQKLGWSFMELDWVLTSINAVEIDKDAILSIAKVKGLADKYKLPVLTLCSLWYDIKTTGEGDGDASKSLFDITFNDPGLLKQRAGATEPYHPKTSDNTLSAADSQYNNPLYRHEPIAWAVGQNAPANTAEQKLGKSIVAGGVPVNQNDIALIAGFLFGGMDTIKLSVSNLSALYRHARLPKLLGLKVSDYLLLLTLLGKESHKALSIADAVQLFETAEWLKKSKFNVYELDYIINGNESPYISKQFTDEKINQLLASLQALMKAEYINEKTFVSPEDNIDEALSKEIYKGFASWGFISEAGIVLVKKTTPQSFRHRYKTQYGQIFANVSEAQAEFAVNKLFSQRAAQEDKLAGQLAVFYGAKAELMPVLMRIGEALLSGYTESWVKTFADNARDLKPDAPAPDIIKKYMLIIGKYLLLSKKLKLKTSDIEGVYSCSFNYNIDNFGSLTLENVKGLYEYKQLTEALRDTSDGLVSYFKAVYHKALSNDTAAYINKQLSDASMGLFMASLQELMQSTYIDGKFFAGVEAGINQVLSQQLFNILLAQGFIDARGVVLLESIPLEVFKQQYAVQYSKMLEIASEAQCDNVLTKLFKQRQTQQSIIVEELAVFLGIEAELMEVLVKTASKILIEHMQNCVQLFADNTSEAGQPVSPLIKRFMVIVSVYLVVAQKLRLEASELELLFLDNGVRDIEDLRKLRLDQPEIPEDFGKLMEMLRDKNGSNSFTGSFSFIRESVLIDGLLEQLCSVTGWDKQQIKELCNYFFEIDFCITLSDTLKLKKCFDIGESIGVDIYFLKELYASKDLPSLTGSWDIYSDYARRILEAVKSRYSGKAWQETYSALNNTLAEKKRDKLVNVAIWKIGQYFSDIKDSESLYKYLLLDVDMSGESQISYIKHALNSVQLYLHRCRMNLEKGVTLKNIPEVWWEWIMSYRVWEANRKVFVYPENYIDPSLRGTKTTLFKGLEESLMQADITAESTESAFRKYLDDFAQLAKLRYVDSYYCTVDYPQRGPKDTLFLFAQTQTSPYNYYYCTREQDGFELEEQAGVWTEWKKIELSINARYITPVYAFNRLFIFWVELKETKDPGSGDSGKMSTYKATIKYSFYNFSGSWISPQSLVEDRVVYINPDTYIETVKPDGGTSPFADKFDMNSVFWQKVYALNVSDDNYGDAPEGTAKAEKIAVMYGPFLLIASSGTKLTVTEPVYIKGDDKSEFDGNLYSAGIDYNRVLDFNAGGYLPVNEAMVLNASLQDDFLLRSSEFLAIGMNDKNSVFKPAVDKVSNSLYVTPSDSIIYDNYMVEYSANTVSTDKRTVLFSSIFSANAKIVTVKNQPGMFIFDNGDETFLLTPFKDRDSKSNLFTQITDSYKIKMADPVLGEGSFVTCVINEDVSAKIYNSLVSNKVVDSNGNVAASMSQDKVALMLTACLKGAALSLTDNQINMVKSVLANTTKDTPIHEDAFAADTDIGIDATLAVKVLQALKSGGLLDADGKLTAKYVPANAYTILSGCLKGDPANLTNTQINAVKNVLSNAAEGAVFDSQDFVISINVSISQALSKKIFQKLFDVGIIDGQGFLAEKFYEDQDFLIVSVCMKDSQINLNSTQIYIVKDILLEPGLVISQNSFVTKIDYATSVSIFMCLKANNILDAQGRLNDTFTTEALYSCLEAAPLNLHVGKIYAVQSILLKNMSKIDGDAFINDTINSQTSNKIFNDLKSNGILDSEGRVSPNLNKNIDLSTILSYLDGTQRNAVKKVLLDLFVPLIIDYTSGEAIDINNINFAVTRISTGAVDGLSGRLFSGGIDKLLSLESQQPSVEKKLMFERLKANPIVKVSDAFLVDGAQVDFKGPYGNYYWELFFHAPMLIAMKLNSNQKFEDAHKWFEYIFDPTLPPMEDDNLKSPEVHHWKFLPFRKYTLESLVDMLQNREEISVYNNDPFDPHAIARLRLGAYEKAVVMACIDNLLDWGDYLFTQFTWESITEATMHYIYAYDLLGGKPKDLGPIKAQKPASFEDIHRKYPVEIPQFLIDLENVLALSATMAIPSTNKPFNAIYAYFSVPGNKQFMSYWDRVEDRLFKIRHCLNIKGEKQLLALFEPEIDPMQLVRAAASDNSVMGAMMHMQSGVPNYRFRYMLERAKDITGTVIELGSAMLAALEKTDAEALSILSNTHEQNILNMTTMQKEKQIEDLLKNLEGIKENLNSAKNRYNTYKRYIEQGLNGYEIANLALMGAAIIPMGISIALKGVSIAGYLSPNTFGLACGGMQWGDAINAGAGIADGVTSILNQVASMVGTAGQYVRRNDDWTLEMRSAEYDVNQIEKTIESTKIQIDIARQDLTIHHKAIEQAKDIEDFLKSKFTSKDLYNWMVARISTLYFQTYKLALDIALQAQRAYQYELGANDSFINIGYWDNLKKGLLAGESLMYSLQYMEKSYGESNIRKLEIEKTISLQQLDPLALLEFKSTGRCNFNLDEALYDYDFPGHYRRQISTISISIPAIVGPYQNLNAMLTQTSNAIVLKSDADAVEYLVKKGQDESLAKPEPGVLRENWIQNQKVAISKGIDDAGMFTLDFNDDRYIPFEGTGAVSSWKLSMPQETNRIDFDSISDVIINIKYTALEGGEDFSRAVKEKLNGVGRKYITCRYFDLKQSFSNAWYTFTHENGAEGKQSLVFALPETMIMPNLGGAALQSVYLKLETEDGILVSDQTGKGAFIKLTVKDTPIDGVPVPVFNNAGIADEEQIKDIQDFTGEWTLEFDLNKVPRAILSQDVLDFDKLKDIALVITYQADPFGNV